ncbi:unnamed protein product [Cyclocybe aegerita]|uniref:DUF6533 domain-containing protein n=1 Tax=Cyclocybe aegerita TaxID=1973307 RepID=A0A8S0WZ57_CYCAE|nr:unnamed protein product [Cyclocybe aegerita]
MSAPAQVAPSPAELLVASFFSGDGLALRALISPPLVTIIHLKHWTVTAILCLLVYDYLCTLDREIAYVWCRPRTFGTYLFLLNRYLPFVDVSMALYALKHPLTPEGCHRTYSTITWFQVSGIAIAQIILYLRTIAIWERNPKVMGILGTMFIATVTVGIVSTKRAMDMLSFAPNIVAPLWFGCTVRTTTPIILVLGIMILISETTIVILTLIRAYQRLRYSNSSWVHQLYKRGYIYYFYMLGLTILNIVIPFLVVPPLRTLFADPQRCLHSIICNRIIFLIHSRQKVDRRTDADDEGTSSRRASRMPWSQTQTGDVVILSTVLNTFHTDPEHYDGI